MDLKSYKDRVGRLSALVEGWHSAEDIPTLERDMALDELRALYEALRFTGAPRHEPETIEEAAGVAPVVESVADEEFTATPIDLGEVLAMSDFLDDEPLFEEIAAEPEATHEILPEQEQVAEPTPEPEPAAEPHRTAMQSLFGFEEDEAMVRHRHKQRVIMSLYDSEPRPAAARPKSQPEPEDEENEVTFEVVEVNVATEPAVPFAEEPEQTEPSPEIEAAEHTAESTPEMPQPAPEEADEPTPEPEPEPTFEPTPEPEPETEEDEDEEFEITEIAVEPLTTAPPTVLGDVINHDVKTLSDTITPPVDVATELRRQEPVDDLRKALDINDKFLLVRDLFEGDDHACDMALDFMSECPTFDDCMIYIAENFAWNPNSDGAKLLMELIERKYE